MSSSPSDSERREDKAIDLEIGRRIRQERIRRGMTQAELAKRIGITSQQTHKYERGLNRIAASRLLRIAEIFGIEASDLLPSAGTASPSPLGPLDIELARNFARLTSQRQRLSVCQLVRSLLPVGEAAETQEPLTAPNTEDARDFFRLKLFVSGATAGSSRRSMNAITEVQRLCEARLAGRYTLEVIDIHLDPTAAHRDRIVAVPTLLKLEPKPKQVLVGDMADGMLADWLGLP